MFIFILSEPVFLNTQHILGNRSQIFFLQQIEYFLFIQFAIRVFGVFGFTFRTVIIKYFYTTFSVMARYLLLKNLDVQLCDSNIMALHERQKGECALLVVLLFQWPCRSESGGV